MITLSGEQLIAIVASSLAIFVGSMIWVFYNLEQISILLSWLLRAFSWASRSLRNKAIQAQVQSRINAAAEAIESEVNNVMPHPVKIEQIISGTEFATLKDGQIVVRIRNEFDNARNMVTATMLYVQAGLLRESRHQIDNSLQKAIDIKIAWSILRTHTDTNIKSYFFTNVYNPIASENKSVGSYCQQIERLDTRGYFTRVYLRELRDGWQKASELLPQDKLKEETKQFTNYLYTIAASRQNKKYPLQFFGNIIKIGIILIAREETLQIHGLLLHKRWLKKKIEIGAETIYLLALGHENVNLAHTLAQWGQTEKILDIVNNQRYKMSSKTGGQVRAVVIACRPKVRKIEVELDTEEGVRNSLGLQIPEIASGQVEILDVVREPGTQSNVVISTTTNSNIQSLHRLAAVYNRRLNELIGDLQEPTRLIVWDEDSKIFMLNCLGIPHDNLVSVNIDRHQKLATVTVSDNTTAARAIGTKGRNVRLAEKTVGINIRIQVQS